MVFENLKAKLGSHNKSHPLATQRDEFLAVNHDTPLERKSHFTPEIAGAAAASEALKAFENHEVQTETTKVTHARAKDIVGGLADGFVLRLVEEKGLPFTSEADKHKFITEAQHAARRDSKRALRESGIYSANELDAIEEDEKHANKVM